MGLRGTKISTSTGSSVTVSLTLDAPGGGSVAAVAGDLALLFVSAAYNITGLPSGWTTDAINSGTTWNHYIAEKVLTSGDIAAGSVTISIAGAYDCVAALAVHVGNPSVVESEAAATSSSVAQTLTCSSSVSSSDIGVYWASSRSPGIVNVAPGAGSATLLQTGTTGDSLSKLWMQSMPGGTQANLFNADGVQGLVYQVFTTTGGGGGGTGLLIAPGLDGMGSRSQLKGGCNG